MSDWVSHPDDVQRLVGQWEAEHADLLGVEKSVHYAGRPVFALTVTDPSTPPEGKKKAIFFKPHAHEPAPIAAQMNVLSQLLTGVTISGAPATFDRDRLLSECVLCFMPDANPAGTAAAPVEAWDGTQYTNEEFWAWMRGVDPETGKMWKRVDLWDDSQEDPLPTRYGIVYEQISEHEYVEPNRHERSSLLQWLERLRERTQWDRLLDMHQTEFVGQSQNAMVILPAGYTTQPQERQQIETRWADRLLHAWGEIDGGRPIMKAEPLNYGPDQLNYFLRVFGEIYQTGNIITTEIQNNSLLTPPPLQQKLNEVAILATVEDMLEV
ncbi:MAG: M14 family zinc carboxypeptidase [Armatimonadota bacterium]